MSNMPPVTFQIPDLQTGSEIIARFPLTNPPQAAADLNRFLDSLMSAPPESETYFLLLEQARVQISFIAEELAKRYLNKPLPLGEIEEGFFQQVVALWLKTVKAYAHCAQNDETEQSDGNHVLRVATTLHRCICYTGMAIVEHHRARREFPWGLWLDLHGYYASAEEWGVANVGLPDALDPLGRMTHCTAAYVRFVLCDMAGCYSLSIREQNLVRRWAWLWSPLVTLHKAEPGETLPSFVVDLMQDFALRPVAECLQTDNVRCLDTSRLAAQISQVRQQLKQRVSPIQLALGEDCTSGQCQRLLEKLSRPWAQVRAARKFRRHATSGIAKLCTGFDEMHYRISGKPFEQPDNVRTYSRQEFESLFAFRHQVDPNEVLQFNQEHLGFSSDEWEVVNQSANGFRLVRSTSGRRMVHGQLLALCPHDGERYLLARTTWLMQEKGGGLIAGIEALPGLPAAIAARVQEPSSDGKIDGKYYRVFLLPAVSSVGSEQTLVLPAGWYRTGRIVELFTEGSWRVRLSKVVDDGPDFERAGFTVC